MDASKIASHITNIEALRSKDAEEIRPMLEKFPYASTLYILHLKALANDNSLDFEQKLKVAAAHVSDREHLYHLINNNETEETEEVVELEVDNIQSEDVLKEKEIELAEEHSNIKEEVQEVFVLKEETRLEETPIVLDEEDENVQEEQSSLDEEIFSHAIATAFEHSSEELIGDSGQNTELKEGTPAKEDVVIEELKEEVIPADISFIDWLNLKKSGTEAITFEKASTEDQKDTKEGVKEDKNIVEKIKQSDEKRMSKKEINALLDKFISEQPSISKPVKDFFDPSTNAKKSVEESSELVSETLAQIHVMQGNYAKAIKAYKQLSLLYPEKKAFFASQIKKIESKLG
jgi:hypothetical protein